MDDDFRDDVPRTLLQRPQFWFVVPLLACFVLAAALCLDVPGFVKGETDLLGNYVFEAEREDAAAQMTPMERVHAELFPAWLIARANEWPDAQTKFDALRDAADDEMLRTVLDELRAAMDDGSIFRPPVSSVALPDMGELAPDAGTITTAEPARPIHVELLQRWNERLARLEQPFYITGSVSTVSRGAALIGEFYRRLGAPPVMVGARLVPTVILQRIDRTNIVEAYLGVAHPGGTAIVVTDRILDLATDDVWLMFNPETAPMDELAQAYIDVIRREATAGLGADTVARLAAAAEHRRRLLDTIAGVYERASCGNTMRFGTITWDGLNPRDLDRLDAYAERDKIQPCPAMKFAEVDALREASAALQTDATKQALESLVAWLTKMIALHEARHVADELELGRLEDPADCPGCPERMHRNTRAELSAYVASFAWSESPATALYQACTVRGGPHRRAVGFINQQLGRHCTDPPPPDLAEQAQQLQRLLIGSAPPMSLNADFPDRLEIHRFR